MKSSQTKLDHKLGKDHHDYHDKKVTWIIINSCIVCKVIHWITKLIQIANTFYWQPCANAAKRNFEPLLKFLLKGWILKKSADKWFQARTFATGRPAYVAYNVYWCLLSVYRFIVFLYLLQCRWRMARKLSKQILAESPHTGARVASRS